VLKVACAPTSPIWVTLRTPAETQGTIEGDSTEQTVRHYKYPLYLHLSLVVCLRLL